MTERLDLPRRYREQIEALLREHVPGVEVWAYGSRVKGKSHKGSDLDLVLRGPDLQRIDSGQLMDLTEALEESNVPIIVQTHDWARLPERFHREIEREYVVLVEKKGWKTVTLRDLGTIITGKTPSTRRKTNFGGQIPFVTPRDLDDIRMIYKTERYLTDAGAYTVKNAVIPANTVMVSCIGSDMGKAAIAGKRCVTNQQINSIIINDKFDYRYIYYSLSTRKDELRDQAGGSAVPILNKGHFGNIKIYLPPLPEQRAIAHILSSLDDKIELNRRMNETLEEMGRALFKSWFVDFDPVRAKMEGRDTGLPPDVADLFPDRLVESELGEMPEGWKVKAVGTIASIVGGTTPSTKQAQYWKGGTHCWATPKDLASLSVPVLLKTERKITDAGLGKIGSGLLPPGTVLLSSRAPIGYLAVTETPVAINQGFIGIMPHEGISNLFMLYWSEASHDEIINHANGSTFLEINKGNFRQLPVVVPDESAMKKFDGLARTLYNRIVSNERQSHSLAALRDTLLPKLISGEIRVNTRDEESEAVIGKYQ